MSDESSAGGGFGISERIRQEFVDRITDGYSQDYLTEDEFEHRLDEANKASDVRQLRRLVADLPRIDQQMPAPTVGTASHSGTTALTAEGEFAYQIAQRRPEEDDTVLCIFGGAERGGEHAIAKRTRSITVFGGTDFDLRDTPFVPGQEYVIECLTVFGGVDIYVPPGINVVVNGVGIFGGFGGKSRSVGADSPTVRVKGLALFGGVDVRVKEPKRRKARGSS